jgi:hypothetical protein
MMAAGLRATAKAAEHPPEPKVGAPALDPTRVEQATLKARRLTCLGFIWKTRPRERGLQCTKVLSSRRSSGSGRQQMPVLGQNDFIDGVNDAVLRDEIRLLDAGPVHPYVSGGYRCR